MILKASERGGAKQLAAHLLKMVENEHVEVHDVRGFVSDDLKSAMQEAYAVSRGTRCKKFLFSLSLNPPVGAKVPVHVFEDTIRKIEQKLGLEGHARAIVFHEKEGRRHAHCVWSRINTETMTAVNLPFFKDRLRQISKQLYLENGWTMPRGLVDSKERDPANFTRAQWQQAKRAGQDPRVLKSMFQECWAISDSKEAFAKALEERGFHLARGDRRGFVALDFRGEVYSVARYAGVRTKDVKAKLGELDGLPSVAQTQAAISARMTKVVRGYIEESLSAFKAGSATLAFRKSQLTQQHRDERKRLEEAQKARWAEETKQRAQRMSRGFRGVWDRLTGKYAHIRKQNELETWQCYLRDRTQKDMLIERHLDERRDLQLEITHVRNIHAKEMKQLHRDVAHYMSLGRDESPLMQDHFREAARPDARDQGADRSHGLDMGPSP